MLLELLGSGVANAAAFILLFLSTYLVHSTLMLSLAWVAARVRLPKSNSFKDVLFKTALIGGLITAPVQVWPLQLL